MPYKEGPPRGLRGGALRCAGRRLALGGRPGVPAASAARWASPTPQRSAPSPGASHTVSPAPHTPHTGPGRPPGTPGTVRKLGVELRNREFHNPLPWKPHRQLPAPRPPQGFMPLAVCCGASPSGLGIRGGLGGPPFPSPGAAESAAEQRGAPQAPGQES